MHLRLERITADCVAPMEAEPSIEGRPPGEQERQPHGQVARPKRARGSGRPETGLSGKSWAISWMVPNFFSALRAG